MCGPLNESSRLMLIELRKRLLKLRSSIQSSPTMVPSISDIHIDLYALDGAVEAFVEQLQLGGYLREKEVVSNGEQQADSHSKNLPPAVRVRTTRRSGRKTFNRTFRRK